MTNILPSITGLTVDGVIYQYTTVKNAADPMLVSVQNKNRLGDGYIFRSQDDWSGLRGNTITKLVPVNNIPGTYWGNGEINVDGRGEVRNTSVIYKYRYDTCVDPLSSPACPGYDLAMLKKLSLKDTEPVDPLANDLVRAAIENKTLINEQQQIRQNELLLERKSKERTISPNSLLNPKDIKLAIDLELLNNIPGLDQYRININGGVYNDVLRYSDKILPDSRSARRLSLSQERMHRAIVDSQYK
jgi:hypothetical protein